MNDITIKQITTTDSEYKELLHFRNELLRKPLGLDLFSEDRSADEQDIILVATLNDRVVGCVMLHPEDEITLKLRQMAVSESIQNKGLGRQLVAEAEQAARDQGVTKIILHARITAESFYKKLGYSSFGNIFQEVTIPHIAMKKTL